MASRRAKNNASTSKTERSGVAVLMHWMRNIISEERLNLGPPDVETIGPDRKMPDLVIYKSSKSKAPLVIIEAKTPEYDAYSEEDLKAPAREKAAQRRAAYFVTTNFQTIVWWNTTKCLAPGIPEDEQIVNIYELPKIQSLTLELETSRVAEQFKATLRTFLRELDGVTHGHLSEPRIPIDKFLVRRLQEKIRLIASSIIDGISELFDTDPGFAESLRNWFADQGWTFNESPGDFERAARQSAYLLINKIFFYNLLREKHPKELNPLHIPAGMSKPALLQKTLQAYFDEVLSIDYESIYKIEFLDTLVFTGSEETVEEIGELVDVLNRYDFSQQLGYDVIGHIFEQLIPSHERHILGQYFTNSLVVDLILQFCVKRDTDVVLDPACGAGTFLVRAYALKKHFNGLLGHEEILETLWGSEISKFPAHLATINLAKADLSSDSNYPHVLHRDFFEIQPKTDSVASIGTLSSKNKVVGIPESFDAIIGNPPYTRQEDIGGIAPEIADYKASLIENALAYNGRKLANMSSRAGLHAYFFVHSWKFLRDGGRFGFVVLDTWLDAKYGVGLQHFLLNHFRIVAIIGSECERWFDEADANTCITLLERCDDDDQRMNNIVRFATLRVDLNSVIRLAGDEHERDVSRWQSLQLLCKSLLAHNDNYEGKDFRVRAMPQKLLLDEGTKDGAYKGSKWSRHLKAPLLFFEILKKPSFVKLGDVAEVRRGFTTGADAWFYVEEVKGYESELLQVAQRHNSSAAELTMIKSGDGSLWPIESRFLAPVIKSPSDLYRINIEPMQLPDRVVLVRESERELQGTLVLSYIRHGEKKPYDMGKGSRVIPAKTETCRGRKLWYALPDMPPARIFFQKAIFETHRHYIASRPIHANQRFYPIVAHKGEHTEFIAAALNSSWTALWLEVQRAALGLGAIEATVEEVRDLVIPNPNLIDQETKRSIASLLKKMGARDIGSFTEEFGAAGLGAGLRKDRVNLESLVLGTVGGFSSYEQKQVWSAVTSLGGLRLAKAASVKDSSDAIDKRNLLRAAKAILTHLGTKTIPDIIKQTAGTSDVGRKIRLPRILNSDPSHAAKLPTVRKQLKGMGWDVRWGERVVQCPTQAEARIIAVALRGGAKEVELFGDEATLVDAANHIDKLVEAAEKELATYLTEQHGPRERQRLAQSVLAGLWGRRLR